MEYLVLHIDLEHISGVVTTSDGLNIYPLESPDNSTSNKYWLYFHIDQYNQRVVNKNKFREKVYEKLPGYIGHLFQRNLEIETFLFNDQNYNILELIEEAGIIDSIKNQYFEHSKSSEIRTFITFSDNISTGKMELIKNFFVSKEFNIISYAVPIAELICFFKQDVFLSLEPAVEQIILLDALNDNLNISFLSFENGLFSRKDNSIRVFSNMGKDPREKTILDYVISELKIQTNFLRNEARVQEAFLRLSKNANIWLNRLDMINELYLDDVTLPNSTTTKYRVRILKKEVENRTRRYINDLISEYRRFKTKHITSNNYRLILIGETLGNSQIQKRFLSEEGTDLIQNVDQKQLQEILSIYPNANKSFKERIDRAKINANSEALIREGDELLSNKMLAEAKNKYDEARNLIDSKRINKKIASVQKQIIKKREAVDEFNENCTRAELLVKEGRIKEAVVLLDNALEIFPEDKGTIQRRNTLKNEIQKIEYKIKHLNENAIKLYKGEKYNEALSKYNAILKIQPNNLNALKQSEKCQKEIRLKKILFKADDLYKNQLFEEAAVEYKKGIPDTECKERYVQCGKIILGLKEIDSFLVQVDISIQNEDYDLAQTLIKSWESVRHDLFSINKDIDLSEQDNKILDLQSLASKEIKEQLRPVKDVHVAEILNSTISKAPLDAENEALTSKFDEQLPTLEKYSKVDPEKAIELLDNNKAITIDQVALSKNLRAQAEESNKLRIEFDKQEPDIEKYSKVDPVKAIKLLKEHQAITTEQLTVSNNLQVQAEKNNKLLIEFDKQKPDIEKYSKVDPEKAIKLLKKHQAITTEQLTASNDLQVQAEKNNKLLIEFDKQKPDIEKYSMEDPEKAIELLDNNKAITTDQIDLSNNLKALAEENNRLRLEFDRQKPDIENYSKVDPEKAIELLDNNKAITTDQIDLSKNLKALAEENNRLRLEFDKQKPDIEKYSKVNPEKAIKLLKQHKAITTTQLTASHNLQVQAEKNNNLRLEFDRQKPDIEKNSKVDPERAIELLDNNKAITTDQIDLSTNLKALAEENNRLRLEFDKQKPDIEKCLKEDPERALELLKQHKAITTKQLTASNNLQVQAEKNNNLRIEFDKEMSNLKTLQWMFPSKKIKKLERLTPVTSIQFDSKSKLTNSYKKIIKNTLIIQFALYTSCLVLALYFDSYYTTVWFLSTMVLLAVFFDYGLLRITFLKKANT